MEIYNNTLLKLIVRQGVNPDRIKILLTSGELGYTTDTERLYVGNGTLSGGVVVGNKFKGSSTDITTLSPCEIGDYVFDPDKRNFYVLNSGDGSDINDWILTGGVYVTGDSYINISNDNTITLNPLSSYSISEDLLSHPLMLTSGKISLDSTAIQNANLYVKFNGLSGATEEFSKLITSSTRLSSGHYRFTYGPLSTTNLIPQTQIIGYDALGYYPRTTFISNSSCDVEILNNVGDKTDANITLLISY
jgi:hypothetical protein